MITATPEPKLSPEQVSAALHTHLFKQEDLRVYAVLDGASIPELLDRLAQDKPEHVCLYRGELEPDLAECAPYLVHLQPQTPFTHWVLGEGWGKHWGIFALTQANLKDLRKHFRTFLRVKNPEGKTLYFRYYDPRVMRVYLPTCIEAELGAIFGPCVAFLLEQDPAVLLGCRLQDKILRITQVVLWSSSASGGL